MYSKDELAKKDRPNFLWDYDLSSSQVREILAQPGLSSTKQWLIERILTEARFDEVWDYLDLKTLQRYFPKLHLPKDVQKRWSYALKRWSRVE